MKHLYVSAIPLILLAGTATADDYPTVDFGGRLMLDAAKYFEDITPLDSGVEVRRARLFAKGNLAADWKYKLQFDFAGGDAELKDGYIQYTGFDKGTVTIGNFKQFYSLEELTSSKYITFMERGLTVGIAEGRRTGVGYLYSGGNFTVGVSAFTDEANGEVKGSGLSGRATWLPYHNESSLLHLGFQVKPQNPDSDTIRVRSRPEAHVDDTRFLDTGPITGVNDTFTYGPEFAWVAGPFSLQGEYAIGDINRENQPDLSFSGGYLYASYFLTGESRNYNSKNASFGRVKPASDRGAWEIAGRVSSLDLTDKDIMGGSGEGYTFGVNYYATSHLRFMANYVVTDLDEVSGGDSPEILQVRMSYDF
ncbi:MAG: porin [Lysobacteraceae bacterium]|nr:MAG: porin [Xanthomonadaceae bacterium]